MQSFRINTKNYDLTSMQNTSTDPLKDLEDLLGVKINETGPKGLDKEEMDKDKEEKQKPELEELENEPLPKLDFERPTMDELSSILGEASTFDMNIPEFTPDPIDSVSPTTAVSTRPEPTLDSKTLYTKKLALQNQILQYYAKFGKKLGEMPENLDLDRPSIQELTRLRDELQLKLSCSSNFDYVRKFVDMSTVVVEIAGRKMGYNTSGYAMAVSSEPGYKEVADELALKYSNSIQLEPEWRLAMTLAQSMIVMDKINTKRDEIRINIERKKNSVAEQKKPIKIDTKHEKNCKEETEPNEIPNDTDKKEENINV